MQGLPPAFIAWSPGPHPSTAQTDHGVILEKIELAHSDPAKLTSMLEALNVLHLATVVKGYAQLSFTLKTDQGSVVID